MKRVSGLACMYACMCIAAAMVVSGCIRVHQSEPSHAGTGSDRRGHEAGPASLTRRSLLIAKAVQKLGKTSATDVLKLSSGHTRSGTILNKTFTVKTDYGRITLARNMLRGILDTPGASGKTVVTAGTNWFSGRLQDKDILFRNMDGTTDNIPVADIRQLVFHKRSGSGESLSKPLGQVVEMTNGDVFEGTLLDTTILIGLTNSDMTIVMADVDRLEMIDGLARVRIRKSGDVILGVLKTSALRVNLDAGGQVTIVPTRITMLHPVGTVPSPIAVARQAVSVVHMGEDIPTVSTDSLEKEYRKIMKEARSIRDELKREVEELSK